MLDLNARITLRLIVGVPRSGTTLLANMLSRLPDSTVPPETHFYVRTTTAKNVIRGLIKHTHDNLVNILFENPYIEDLNLEKADVERCFRSYPCSYDNLFAALLEAYSVAKDKRFVIEKTPHHFERLPHILKANPQAKIVHIIRDGRDVVLSLMRARWTHDNWQRHAGYWGWCIRYLRKLEGMYPENIFTIRFEDMVQDPESVIRDIANFYQIPYASGGLMCSQNSDAVPQWELAWKAESLGPPNKEVLQAWRKEDFGYVAEIQKVIRSELALAGYEIHSETGNSNLQKKYRQMSLLWEKPLANSVYPAIRQFRFFFPKKLTYKEVQPRA